ncbi:MAG TPA: hypothetical protein VE442_13225 [Jatrophihabitans sp.]|nr:hypothetical protein [Jatrophihabitans sp.]
MPPPPAESLDTTDPEPMHKDAAPPSPGQWAMWAGIERRTRPASAHPVETLYCSLSADIHFPSRRGHAVLMPVLVAEDPEGQYWGWLTDEAIGPTLVQRQKQDLERMLPAPPDSERWARRGRVVRLAIKPLTDD